MPYDFGSWNLDKLIFFCILAASSTQAQTKLCCSVKQHVESMTSRSPYWNIKDDLKH